MHSRNSIKFSRIGSLKLIFKTFENVKFTILMQEKET